MGNLGTQEIHASRMAAKAVGVSHGYVSDAKAIQNKAPDLAQRVRAGELTIPKAKAEINKREPNIEHN